MKNILFILSIASIFTLSSCSKEDDGSACTRDNWLGSYSGELGCLGQDPQTLSFMVVAGTSDNSIQIEIDGGASVGFLPEDDIIVDGCTIPEESVTADFLGSPITLSFAGSLEESSVVFDISANIQGQTINCMLTAAK